jgi:hypothetical protein
MGKIVISENVTLDGVIQDPAGDEGDVVFLTYESSGRLNRRRTAPAFREARMPAVRRASGSS